MYRIKMAALTMTVVFLSASLSYCQELSDWERQIFYDAAEWEFSHYEDIAYSDTATDEEMNIVTQKFLDQKGITKEQLKDITVRGLKMPLTATEEEVARELRNATENSAFDQIIVVCKNLAYKYGMSLGQVGSIFVRIQEEEY